MVVDCGGISGQLVLESALQLLQFVFNGLDHLLSPSFCIGAGMTPEDVTKVSQIMLQFFNVLLLIAPAS